MYILVILDGVRVHFSYRHSYVVVVSSKTNYHQCDPLKRYSFDQFMWYIFTTETDNIIIYSPLETLFVLKYSLHSP